MAISKQRLGVEQVTCVACNLIVPICCTEKYVGSDGKEVRIHRPEEAASLCLRSQAAMPDRAQAWRIFHRVAESQLMEVQPAV